MADTATVPNRARVPNHVVVRVAAAASADPKTVRKVIAGEPVRGGVYDRICAVLKREQIEYPAPVDDDA